MKVVIFLTVTIFANIIFAQDFACQHGLFGPTTNTLIEMGKCLSESESTNSKCEYFCVAKLFNLLEANGLPSKATYEKLTKKFPENHHEKILKHFNDCMDKHGSKIDLADKTCSQADQLHTCTWTIIDELEC